MKKIENEDILIARGAQLDGSDAPFDFDKKRARSFVGQVMKKEKSNLFEKLFGQRPVAFWYASGAVLVAACAAVVITLNNPGGTKGSINKMESVHCTIDTVETATDSTVMKNVEIISLDE